MQPTRLLIQMTNARQWHGQPLINGFSIVKGGRWGMAERDGLLANRSLTQVVVGWAGMGSQMCSAPNQPREMLARCSMET